MHNNTLGSFSFDVVKRMLDVLSEHGRRMKKTNLASKAGLNYNVCLRYIRMLNNLRWIEAGHGVSITEEGKRVSAELLDVSESRASSIDLDDRGDIWLSISDKESIKHPLPYGTYSSRTITLTELSSPVMNEEQLFSYSKRVTSKSKKKKTIMIVDDEQDTALIYEYFLLSAGYRVRTFTDGRSALCEYVADPFLYDLLVLDIRMQYINGLQLYQSIKAINPECKAIFVSALDAATEVVSILPGTKPRDIMRKPVSKEQFVTAVRTALVQ